MFLPRHLRQQNLKYISDSFEIHGFGLIYLTKVLIKAI